MLFCKKSEKRNIMKYIAPNYYKKFKCIADKCKHSCCIGWEIDIDNETHEKYKQIQGDFGNKLKENIEITDDIACFQLDCNERCPFLNGNNLCDIILNIGEDYLCQICNDHPRFRNFYGGATEIGLGLCCEAASELIISQNEKVTFEIIDDDGIKDDYIQEDVTFIEFRNKLFEILQNRKITINQRINKFLKLCNTEFIEESPTISVDFLLELERLDNKWTDVLNELKIASDLTDIVLPSCFDTVAEQLLIYFTYRHLCGCLDDGRLPQRANFIIFSYKIIERLCKYHLNKFSKLTYNDIAEYARLFSSEIEYSEENIETILNKFS